MIVRTDLATAAAVERVVANAHLASVSLFITIAIGIAGLTEAIAVTRGTTQG